MNCKPGELAFVIRNNPHAQIGEVVRVNHWTAVTGAGRWDVEDMCGTFFLLHDDDLCAMRGWEDAPGCRDELFDPVWIFGDYVSGHCKLNQIGLSMHQAQSRRAR
jgi:hypothetical protein